MCCFCINLFRVVGSRENLLKSNSSSSRTSSSRSIHTARRPFFFRPCNIRGNKLFKRDAKEEVASHGSSLALFGSLLVTVGPTMFVSAPWSSSVFGADTLSRSVASVRFHINRQPMKEFLHAIIILAITIQSEIGGEIREEQKCRTRNGIFLPKDSFNLHSCLSCYRYMLNHTMKVKLNESELEEITANVTSYVDLLDHRFMLNSFLGPETADKWRECCHNAAECCTTMLADATKSDNGSCPRTWDGWLCWSDTPSGASQQKLCPSYSISSLESCSDSYATKKCTDEGKWWRFNGMKAENEWTDYTECSPKKLMETRLYVKIGSYALSVIALIPALIIFQKFRSLQCHRIILHKNLFASLLLHCSTQIAFNVEYALSPLSGKATMEQSELSCKILVIVMQYFRLTNYMWMLCEGFYLHRQIVNVFAEENRIRMFYLIGWGFPIIPLSIYYALRKAVDDAYCWALPSTYIDWVIHLPCLFSLIINAVFLINIVVVLITKLRAVHADEPSQFRKAVRATLVLIPLFGIHFLFTIYRLESVCSGVSKFYVYMGYLVDGLQGLLVAVIFCFNNSEVLTVLKRSWRNAYEKHNISQIQSTYNGTVTSVVHSQTVL